VKSTTSFGGHIQPPRMIDQANGWRPAALLAVQFEYTAIDVFDLSMTALLQYLEGLGKDGWEYVGPVLALQATDSGQVLFKRRKMRLEAGLDVNVEPKKKGKK
jgi:hypothetical protein